MYSPTAAPDWLMMVPAIGDRSSMAGWLAPAFSPPRLVLACR
jgi:hypothetical protein